MDPLEPRNWTRISPILDAVLDADPSERGVILSEMTAGDAELRLAVEHLLPASDAEADLLSRPAPEVAAGLLTGRGSAAGWSASTDTAPAASAGDVIAGYRIEALLGRGGMGDVFRAYDPTLERRVALKVLQQRLSLSEDARRRLIKEARAASTLDHPNIQTVLGAGETDEGRVYIALAFYDGTTVRARLREEGPLAIADCLDIARQTGRGLQAAHHSGIVHRDIKPANLIVTPEGRLKILDFGIARVPGDEATREGAAYGTIAYMSPEQTHGQDIDERTDIWSAGVVLYEMLTGRRPFAGESDRTLIHAIRHDAPPPASERRADAPAGLVDVIGRCLQKDPADRYENAGAFLEALEALGPDGGVLARPGARSSRGSERSRTPSSRIVIASAALVALAGAGIAVLGVRSADERRQPDVLPAAASMTILPFVPVSEDSALRRLGRQLAVTVSTNLDGVGSIRTTEGLTVISALGEASPPAGPVRGADLARRFATRSYVQGTLLDTGEGVRVDAALHDAASGREITRFAVTGPPVEIAALTDSITLKVLRAIWRRGEIPAPSLTAITTSSVPALRSYLDGELFMAAGKFAEAIEAFETAFQEDSTFWFALWRSVYPRFYEQGASLDPALWLALFEHRDALPAPDRLLMESNRLERVLATLEADRDITRRFPTYWPGWWEYANDLVHKGPFVGTTYEDARVALERTLDLYPAFMPGWEHLFWITIGQRDEERSAEVLAELEKLGAAGSVRLARDMLPIYRAKYATVRDGSLSPADVRRTAEAFLGYHGPQPELLHAIVLLMEGDFSGQFEVNQAVLAELAERRDSESPEAAARYRFGSALALAGRGAWDRSLALIGEPPPEVTAIVPLFVYGLSATGAWLGEVSPRRAAEFRPPADSVRRTADGSVMAEYAWLDGIVAFAAGDAAALDAARSRLRGSGAEHAEQLEVSLTAFATALTGDSARAGDMLADLEEELADRAAFVMYGRPHPWFIPINRLAAGRWLAAAGDTTRALRLLGWEEAALSESSVMLWPAGRLVSPPALLLRARLHAARGDTAQAAFYYETLLRRSDQPSDARRGWREEALGFVGRAAYEPAPSAEDRQAAPTP